MSDASHGEAIVRALRHLRGEDVGLTERAAQRSLFAAVTAVSHGALRGRFRQHLDEGLADDACAMTLERCLARGIPVDEPDAAVRYVQRVALSKYVDGWRAREREARLAERLATEPRDDEADEAPDAEVLATIREAADLLLAAVTPRQRKRAGAYLAHRLNPAAPFAMPDPGVDPDAWREAKRARDRAYKDREVGRTYLRAAYARLAPTLTSAVSEIAARIVGVRESDRSDDEGGPRTVGEA